MSATKQSKINIVILNLSNTNLYTNVRNGNKLIYSAYTLNIKITGRNGQ